MPRFTPNTITTFRALRKEIDVVRRTGIAVDREEQTAGICAVGAALDDLGEAFRHERFAVSIPVPAQRFGKRQDASALNCGLNRRRRSGMDSSSRDQEDLSKIIGTSHSRILNLTGQYS
jgi:hypothetical protein